MFKYVVDRVLQTKGQRSRTPSTPVGTNCSVVYPYIPVSIVYKNITNNNNKTHLELETQHVSNPCSSLPIIFLLAASSSVGVVT